MAAKFEIRSPKAGEFRWVLVSQGRTLATGESYSRKVSAEKAIESLRKAAATAIVADLTLAPAKTATGKAAGRPQENRQNRQIACRGRSGPVSAGPLPVGPLRCLDKASSGTSHHSPEAHTGQWHQARSVSQE